MGAHRPASNIPFLMELGATRNTMVQFGLPNKARFLIFLAVAAVSLVGGLILRGPSLAAAYVAVLPTFACYVFAVRPCLLRHLRYYHVFYLMLLAAMVAGY